MRHLFDLNLFVRASIAWKTMLLHRLLLDGLSQVQTTSYLSSTSFETLFSFAIVAYFSVSNFSLLFCFVRRLLGDYFVDVDLVRNSLERRTLITVFRILGLIDDCSCS